MHSRSRLALLGSAAVVLVLGMLAAYWLTLGSLCEGDCPISSSALAVLGATFILVADLVMRALFSTRRWLSIGVVVALLLLFIALSLKPVFVMSPPEPCSTPGPDGPIAGQCMGNVVSIDNQLPLKTVLLLLGVGGILAGWAVDRRTDAPQSIPATPQADPTGPHEDLASVPPRHRVWPSRILRIASVSIGVFVLWYAPIALGILAGLGSKVTLPLAQVVFAASIALALAVAGAEIGRLTGHRDPRDNTWWLTVALCGGALLLEATLIAQFHYAVTHVVIGIL